MGANNDYVFINKIEVDETTFKCIDIYLCDPSFSNQIQRIFDKNINIVPKSNRKYQDNNTQFLNKHYDYDNDNNEKKILKEILNNVNIIPKHNYKKMGQQIIFLIEY